MKNQKSENNLNRNSNWWYLFSLSALFTGIVVILIILGKAGPEDLKNPTESLAHAFRLFFAFFAALSFFGLSTYVTEQIQKDDTLKSTKEDPATKYLTIAMAIFGLSSLLKLINLWCPFCETFPILNIATDKAGEAIFTTILAVLSTINSLLILWAILYLDLDKEYNGNYLIVKSVKRYYNDEIFPNKENWKVKARGFALLIILAEIVLSILYIYNVFKIVKIINIPDLLYSFLTCIVLGAALFTAFILREMRKVAGLAILMTVITLVSQYYSFNGSGLSQYFLALSYTTTFVMLLFSLEVSFLGEKKNTALENQKEQYKRFVEIVGTVLKKDQVETYFNDIAQKLKKENKFDYRFAIAVKSNKDGDNVPDTIENPQVNNMEGYKINYILSEYKEEDEKKEKKIYSPQDTLAGSCIKKGKPDIVYGHEDTKQYSDAGKATSLIFVPLKNKQGECFGAITMQFKYTLNEATKDEKENLLNLLADIFSNCIDPKKYLKEPIDIFLDEFVTEGDGLYHFGATHMLEKNDARNKVNVYGALDLLLNWGPEKTEKKFHLDSNGKYDDRHPLNQMLKGIAAKEDNFSNGMVLFAGIVAFEQLLNNQEYNNPFMDKWNMIYNVWIDNNLDKDKIKEFFRGSNYKEEPKEKYNDWKKDRFNLLYKLFNDLFYYECDNDRNINTININYDIDKLSISIDFNVCNIEKLKKYLEENEKTDNNEQLTHGLSTTIVKIKRSFPPGTFCYEVTNLLSLKFNLL